MIETYRNTLIQKMRNPGLWIALGLFVSLLHSSCSAPEAPHGPDSTRVKDTTHKDTVVHKDTTIHKDSTTYPDTAGGIFNGLFLPRDSEVLNTAIALSGDGTVVASSGFKRSTNELFVYLFDVRTGKILNRIVTPDGPSGIQLDRTGRRMLVEGNSRMFLYNTESGVLLNTFDYGGWLTTSGDSILQYTMDGRGNYGLSFISPTGQTLMQFSLPNGAWPDFLTRDSKTIICTTSDRKLFLLDASTSKQTSTYDLSADIYGGAFSPDGVITGGYLRDQSNAFVMYNTQTGQQLPSSLFTRFSAFVFLNDHRTMAVSYNDPNGTTTNAAIVDLTSGATLQTLPGIFDPYPYVREFALSDDCKLLAGSFWGSVKIWRLR